MRYEELEDALVALFKDQFFTCKPLPDNELEYVANNVPKAFVSYDTSDYMQSENLNCVFQEDRIKIGFMLIGRTRRGASGVFSCRDIIQSTVLGLKLPGYDKFQLTQFTPLEGASPNNWKYYLQFNTVGRVVENQPEETYPLLKDPEFTNE